MRAQWVWRILSMHSGLVSCSTNYRWLRLWIASTLNKYWAESLTRKMTGGSLWKTFARQWKSSAILCRGVSSWLSSFVNLTPQPPTGWFVKSCRSLPGGRHQIPRWLSYSGNWEIILHQSSAKSFWVMIRVRRPRAGKKMKRCHPTTPLMNWTRGKESFDFDLHCQYQ